MKSGAMKNDIIQSYKNRFVQERGMNRSAGSECIVFCKRVTSNIFDIKDGFAVVSGAENCANDGVCMVSNSTKVVFVFDQAQEESESL
jgi:NAD-dependent dihydropyrimidine dehydrogenase PreA subunit